MQLAANAASSRILVAERERRADQEQDAVDHSDNALGQAQLVGLGDHEDNVIVVLDGQHTGRCEHDGADDGEQDVDALVDRCAEHLGCTAKRKKGTLFVVVLIWNILAGWRLAYPEWRPTG